jgi:ADP-ribosyl-[dinitrogen reductase] hydrolase
MEEHQQRVAGVLVGLAAGDENGGPTEMALRLAESLLECRRYDPDDVFARYLDWHRQGAYDTGPVTGRVLAHAFAGMSHSQAAKQTDRELNGMTAGCNAAHRAGVLAMAPWLDIDGLVQAAREEARLTHRHPIAADTAIAVAVKCRDNMMGNSRFASRHLGAVSEQLHAEVKEAVSKPRPVLSRLLDQASPARTELHRGGYSPGTLHAALAFATTGRDPITALQAAKSFAGPANYCPVLVGAFLGARFGADVFDDGQLQHHPAEHIARIRKAAWGLAELWRLDAEETHAG